MKMLTCKGIFLNKQLLWYIIGLWLSILTQFSCSLRNEEQTSVGGLPTVTVRGFLNFKTTVDGTVIVFTPISEPQPQTIAKTTTKSSSIGKQLQTLSANNAIFKNDNALESKDTLSVNNIQDISISHPAIKSDFKDFVHFGKKNDDLQHISENIVVPSTLQTENNLGANPHKKSPSINHYPTGLVTVLGGTQVGNGKTTIFETKVLGTYIDGKYAQILQSTSKIVGTPTSTTETTQMTTLFDASINASPSPSNSRFSTQTNVFKSSTVDKTSDDATLSMNPVRTISRSNEMLRSEIIGLQSSFQIPEMTSKFEVDNPTQSLENAKTNHFIKQTFATTKGFSTTMLPFNFDDVLLLSSKNLRMSSSRIRFQAPKRPSQIVKLNRFKVKLTLRQNSTDGFDLTPPLDNDDIEVEDKELEEENIESSMDLFDPASVTYQETTITSKVTLHVGRRKSIRTLTITTSVPKRIVSTDGGLISQNEQLHAQENIPFTQSIVVTKTYTTTERTYTTTLVPIFDGTNIGSHTVTESFFIMKIVTAYRTLPPGHVTILLPTTTDEPETPLETSIVTLDVAANDQALLTQIPQEQTTETTSIITEITTEPTKSIPKVTVPANNSPTNPMLSFSQPFPNNPLAAVYLGLQQLNAQMTLYSTVTHTSTFVTKSTIFSTKTIRYYDGRSTRFRTSSEPISTTKRTVTTTVTSVQPYINTQAYQHQQQLQKFIAATQLPMQQAQPALTTLTSIYTTSTTATSLSTRIYTLIYNGFSTKFRTVTSTKLYPTVLTVTNTKEVPITATRPPLLPFAYPYPAA